ncbi:MAG TPA: FHA domain-containing protein [Polyangiaceae bacterium]|nr:FHA domain-containing protein [Polyangiaceae bacterium]
MALTVVVRSGDHPTPLKISLDAPRIVIGRGEGCEIRLPDPSVSHRHASIRQRGSDYVVVDEGSTNGTFVGPVRLSPQAPRMLKSGELLRIGRIWLELTIETVPATDDTQLATREIALALVSSALAAQGEAAAIKVIVKSGPDAERELLLSEPGRAYVIGRGQGLDLTLTDADASRRHVEVGRRGPHLWVKDLGSKNGALLDGNPLPANKETIWPRGKLVTIGQSELAFDDPVAEALVELEASSDEKMRDADTVDPPTGAPVGGSPGLGSPETGTAPIARVPRGTPQPAQGERRFRTADLVIALLALAVLGASLVGIIWLSRMK